MKNLCKAGLLLLLGTSLTACASGGGPYQALENRVATASAMGNNAVRRSAESLRCPTGMTAVEDNADMSSDARVDYEERHGDQGGSSYGRGTNQFQTYNSADVRVRAETQANGNRRIQCVRPVSLSLPPAR